MTDEQRKGITTAATVVVLSLNLMALVWGAAKLSASVDRLDEMAIDTRVTMVTITRQLTDHEARISVVEDRTTR